MSFFISKRSSFLLVSLLLHAVVFYYANQIMRQHPEPPLTSSKASVVYRFAENAAPVKAENKETRPVKEKLPALVKAKANETNRPVNKVQSQAPVSVESVNQVEVDAVQEVRSVEKISPPQVVAETEAAVTGSKAEEYIQPKEPVMQTHNKAAPLISEQELAMIESRYTSSLLQAIERHKKYPLKARRRGQEGEVKVRFSILKDGEITDIEVASSSGYASLDRASSGTLAQLGRFEPIPWQLDRESWDFQVPVSFKLN